jgi:hypothetical protein
MVPGTETGTTIPLAAEVKVFVPAMPNAKFGYCMIELMSYGPEKSKFGPDKRVKLPACGQHPAGMLLLQHVVPGGMFVHTGLRFAQL